MVDIEKSVRRHIAAFNAHDAREWAAHYSSDAHIEDPLYPEPLKGRDAAQKDIADLFRAFPDMKLELKSIMTKDHSFALECTLRGTNKGPMELPERTVDATNKPLELEVGVFGGFDDDGKIIEEHRYFDVASQMAQLGVTEE